MTLSVRQRKAAKPVHDTTHQRLQDLFEISKLFARLDDVDGTFRSVLDIVAGTLPLRSAMLIQAKDHRSEMIVWAADGQRPDQLRAVREHALASYAWLMGEGNIESVDVSVHSAAATLPPQPSSDETLKKAVIIIPLVVAHRPLFGALQLQGARVLDVNDVSYVNHIANQLAVALDRHQAWQQDIVRLGQAERGRVDAESERLSALALTVVADTSREKYEALAEQNAALYEQARNAVREREQILAIVSHDLRSPLGTILLSAEVLASDDPPPAQARNAERIKRAASRMSRLIDDLLDFASIEAGRLAVHRAPEAPEALIHETFASFEGVTQKKRQTLKADVDGPLPLIHCDRDRILQVLGNLTSNASKANHEGGTISLSAKRRGADVVFAVADNGPGISPDDIEHLFERYFRSTDAGYKGTGLGLAIAKGIVVAHEGTLWVESELGTGSTFFFTMPVAVPIAVPAG